MRLPSRRRILLGVVLLTLTSIAFAWRRPTLVELRALVQIKCFANHFKIHEAVRLARLNGRELLLVGTIHQYHFSTSYTLADLENVVANYRPDAVAVEIKPRWLELGLPTLGPMEMAHLAVVSPRYGASVHGIDWWEATENTRRAELGLPLVLSDEHRNDRMFALLQPVPGKRVAVFVGYSHLEGFIRRIVAAGGTIEPQSMYAVFRDRGARPELDEKLKEYIGPTISYMRCYIRRYGRKNAWSERVEEALSRREEIRRNFGLRDLPETCTGQEDL